MDTKRILCLTGLTLAIGCSASAFAQMDVPEAVRVPDGHKVAMETVGVGQITYECQAKSDMPGQMAWVFMGPKAALNDSTGKQVGSYYGPPATWEAMDGSKVTGTQVAIAPGGDGNIPHQLVKANPAEGKGAMTGVSYVQRVATKGGVAPAKTCAAANEGERQIVDYQADYLFWANK
ncbi:DUF3455 domain-containing protein [Stutzerimonas zhaodongensis]|jgi:hypothetical protein|uniref:DUF3455 domain-containing protein n=1 Tax=Stutzerimonas zhaodongensis TaxID=1176257 RepID=A0ABX8J021_9GAMM|nr:DUF3455 domain-containing protein [Stutzerimonas zhaodongensis]QWV19118.1 DUF3455 domain-containing protein [Stutzerimonas zhaodongensis]